MIPPLPTPDRASELRRAGMCTLLFVGVAALVVASTRCGGGGGPCDTTDDCAANSVCYNGTCYGIGARPLGAACGVDTDCADVALVCEPGLSICATQCDPNGANTCPDSFLCHTGGHCLPQHSLELGSACLDSRLCPMGSNDGVAWESRCIENNCVVPCTQGYATVGCPEGRYCQVFNQPTCKPPQPQCTPGDDSTCPQAPAAKVCVAAATDLGVCLRPCLYTVTDNGVYSDDCPPGIGSFNATCAPVGVLETSVCIEAALSGGAVGADCNNGSNLCARGNLCVEGTCRKACSTSCTVGTCTDVAVGFKACL